MTNEVTQNPQVEGLVGWYRHYRRWLEWAYWPFMRSIQAWLTATSVIMEYARRGTSLDSWEPYAWEFSSVAASLLGIWLIIPLDRRYPLNSRDLWRNLGVHLAFTLVYSAVHVIGMVSIREMVYLWMGRSYDFGDWSTEAWYEYRKDALTYLSVLMTIYIYRFVSSRVISEASPITSGDNPDNGQRTERFLIRKLGREFLIKTSEIEWVGAAGNYMNMHAMGRIYPIRETMAGLEKRLNDDHFVRVHRSHIVNLDFIESIKPVDSGDAVIHMRDGARIRLSRSFRDNLRARMQ